MIRVGAAGDIADTVQVEAIEIKLFHGAVHAAGNEILPDAVVADTEKFLPGDGRVIVVRPTAGGHPDALIPQQVRFRREAGDESAEIEQCLAISLLDDFDDPAELLFLLGRGADITVSVVPVFEERDRAQAVFLYHLVKVRDIPRQRLAQVGHYLETVIPERLAHRLDRCGLETEAPGDDLADRRRRVDHVNAKGDAVAIADDLDGAVRLFQMPTGVALGEPLQAVVFVPQPQRRQKRGGEAGFRKQSWLLLGPRASSIAVVPEETRVLLRERDLQRQPGERVRRARHLPVKPDHAVIVDGDVDLKGMLAFGGA